MKLKEYIKFKWIETDDISPKMETLPFLIFGFILIGFTGWFVIVSLYYIGNRYFEWLWN